MRLSRIKLDVSDYVIDLDNSHMMSKAIEAFREDIFWLERALEERIILEEDPELTEDQIPVCFREV